MIFSIFRMSKKGSSSSDENLDLHNWYDNDQYLERRDINDTADNTSDSAQRENVNLLTRVALSIVGDDPNSQDPTLRQATGGTQCFESHKSLWFI